MQQQRATRRHHTFDEYLALERHSNVKHEFIDGEIVAMAGGSRRHNALALRVGFALETHRRASSGCVAFQSDQKVRVLATGRTTYPDVSMVCGPIEGDPADPERAIITNPSLIVEVLSPSTEEDDRGDKWRDYQRIPALIEYVLVSSGGPRVEVFRRVGDAGEGTWEYRAITSGVVELLTGPRLDLQALYEELPD